MNILVTFLLLILTGQFAFAQSINLCKYYTLSISNETIDGVTRTFPLIERAHAQHDVLSRFIKAHPHRYDYLIVKYYDSLSTGITNNRALNLDSVLCEKLRVHDRFTLNFSHLAPPRFQSAPNSKAIFTQDEYFLAASRFFYCDTVFTQDTSIGSHICIGINGRKSLPTDKDITALEAFSIEAILSYLTSNTSPAFTSDFREAIDTSLARHKKHFTSFDALLRDVRQDCYTSMIQSKDLRKKLIRYYQKHKATVNFVVEN
ncbi:MAG: hypothetical protein IPM69_10640 [Ignavibacteria bacterium]|nr:hypothetical protein [Ignavibacteria bacterium]